MKWQKIALGLSLKYKGVDEAESYLEKLSPNSEEEKDFILSQKLNLQYLHNPTDHNISDQEIQSLRVIAQKAQPMAGFSRAIYYRVTGERIILPLE